MTRSYTARLLSHAVLPLLALSAACRADAADATSGDLGEAIFGGTPIAEVRMRYENVEQANLVPRAESFSIRTRLGWETAEWHGFKALIEVANNFHVDDGHFNVAVPGGVSLNGHTAYPIINDPQYTDLNRAQLTYAALPFLSLTAGRQRVLIDDQRFIGNVGWRQDEQRFDAARADLVLDQFKATYAYVWRVDRTLGGKLDWTSDSHLLNASYAFGDPLKVEGYVYALNFANAPTSSTLTTGLRGSGKMPVGAFALTYSATYAHQSDYGNNPARFGLDFWQAGVGAAYDIVTVDADYESLGGNGARGFITPLGTTHSFQGWADAFTAVGGNKTHVDGIDDFNVGIILKPDWIFGPIAKPELSLRHYDFWAELTGAHLGQEWDAQLKAVVASDLTAALKFAVFDQASFVPVGTVAAPPSRAKFWVTVEYKL